MLGEDLENVLVEDGGDGTVGEVETEKVDSRGGEMGYCKGERNGVPFQYEILIRARQLKLSGNGKTVIWVMEERTFE